MFSFGVMASGGGSNFKVLLEKIKDGSLPAQCRFLIVNNRDCGAVQIANEHEIPFFHISGKTHPDPEDYNNAMLQVLKDKPVDLLLLAGFMKKIPEEVIQALPERIINIHPALLPKYGGKGFWGMNVHRAVIEHKEKCSGPTVHLVTSEIDKGKILAQTPVPVLEGDTPEVLAARVLQQEHKLYWKTVLDYAKALGFHQ